MELKSINVLEGIMARHVDFIFKSPETRKVFGTRGYEVYMILAENLPLPEKQLEWRHGGTTEEMLSYVALHEAIRKIADEETSLKLDYRYVRGYLLH